MTDIHRNPYEQPTILPTAYRPPRQRPGWLAVVASVVAAGLSGRWREACDAMARIPISGSASSLNAATAATVVLYEAARQRASLRLIQKFVLFRLMLRSSPTLTCTGHSHGLNRPVLASRF